MQPEEPAPAPPGKKLGLLLSTRAGQAGFGLDLAVFPVGRRQFDLRPDAEEQARQGEREIQGIPQWHHTSSNWIDSAPTISFKRNAAKLAGIEHELSRRAMPLVPAWQRWAGCHPVI